MYQGQAEVVRLLRSMSDDELESLYAEGLLERKRGGPRDGDVARSNALMELVEREVDKRMDEGPRF